MALAHPDALSPPAPRQGPPPFGSGPCLGALGLTGPRERTGDPVAYFAVSTALAVWLPHMVRVRSSAAASVALLL